MKEHELIDSQGQERLLRLILSNFYYVNEKKNQSSQCVMIYPSQIQSYLDSILFQVTPDHHCLWDIAYDLM